MIEMYNWALMNFDGNYSDLNDTEIRLSGTVYDDDRFEPGSFVITSKIISSSGRSIVTENGTHYYLIGDPENSWISHCKTQGICVNFDNPVDI